MKRFEVLWYEGQNEEDSLEKDPLTKEFSTLKAAMNFYNNHKNDSDKHLWWVTKRDDEWNVIEDYVY